MFSTNIGTIDRALRIVGGIALLLFAAATAGPKTMTATIRNRPCCVAICGSISTASVVRGKRSRLTLR